MLDSAIAEVARLAHDRFSFWTGFLNQVEAGSVAEIGVLRGRFAERLLTECPRIEKYYLIDPWRQLDNWRKPANRSSAEFVDIRAEALERTEFASARRIELRGTTAEVVASIPDGSLDFVYVDGDHTLRGIATDLHLISPKVKAGGWIGGDDFNADVWHHGPDFEPTQVFPYAVYFAEMQRCSIWAVGHQQFLIRLNSTGYRFKDLTGSYPPPTFLDAGGAKFRRRGPLRWNRSRRGKKNSK